MFSLTMISGDRLRVLQCLGRWRNVSYIFNGVNASELGDNQLYIEVDERVSGEE